MKAHKHALQVSLYGWASVTALTLAGGLCNANAQTTPKPDASAKEPAEVVVTGSRLRGVAPVGAAVISISRNDITASKETTTDRIIKELPQVLDLGVSENSRGQSGGAGNIVYENTINLRGIGPYSTLILVDGHRVVNNSRSTDPSVIPSLGVERVEVIADGASAIYGSDAVAGVVNIIQRRTLNGGEAFGRYGTSEDGAFHQSQYGMALGKVWTGGQFMVAAEHVDRSALSGDKRSFFTNNQTGLGGNDYRVTTCDPGTITAGTTTYAIPATGVTASGASSLVAGTSNRCDSLTGQDLFPQQQYTSMNFTYSQDISDVLNVYADGFNSTRKFMRQPAYGTATLTVPNTNAFWVAPTGFAGTSEKVAYSFRNDLPRDTQTGTSKSHQFTVGFKLKLPGAWRLEGLYDNGTTTDTSATIRGVNNTALNAALASSNPATAFDPFGLHRTNTNVLAGIANQIFLAPTTGVFKGYEWRIGGPLFDLPGGQVKVAAGLEHQGLRADLGTAIGNPGTPVTWRSFNRNVDSAYAELYIPIVGAANAFPGVKKLELDVAERTDKYSDVGKTSNPKYGFNWQVVDNFKIRGSYGTSFRAPLISQIYGNSNRLFVQSYQNPAGGAPIVGVAVSGANLNLKPETAKTKSLTFDWAPLPQLRGSVTYWDIEYRNQVVAQLSNLAILGTESQFAGTGIILRDAAAAAAVNGFVAQGLSVAGVLPSPVTLFVDGRNVNLGVSQTRGYDFNVTYDFPTMPFGDVSANYTGTYLTHYSEAITPSAPQLNLLNTIFHPVRFKSRFNLTLAKNALRVAAVMSYVNSYTNTSAPVGASTRKVDAYAPVDLKFALDLGEQFPERDALKGTMITAEVINIGDVKPPYVNLAPSGNGSGGYDATLANPIGRAYGISLRKKW